MLDTISANRFQDSLAKLNTDHSFTSVKYWEDVASSRLPHLMPMSGMVGLKTATKRGGV